MNLTVEYLIRSGSIRNFFEVPCSFCLESPNKVVIVIQSVSDRPDFIQVCKWEIDHIEENWPRVSSSLVEIKNLLDDENIVLPGYRLLEYQDESVEVKYNTFRQPMDQVRYDYYMSHFLNSQSNRISRINWLWKYFRNHFFGLRSSSNDQWQFGRERAYVKQSSRYSVEWNLWDEWRDKILPESEVAGELMFWKSYKKNSLICQYPWSCTSS